jgi:hypothetical protein
MKKLLLFIVITTFAAFTFTVNGQSLTFSTTIKILGNPITDTLDDGSVITFDTSSDDAEQENNEMDAVYDDDIDAGWEGDPEDQNILTAGMRFVGIDIPKGATIDSAFVYVHSHEGKSSDDVARITIVGEDADFAETYDLVNLITDRTQTTASVLWECDEEWELWGEYRTPDIKDIVQEIIDRPGWNTGNPLNFIFKGEDQGPSTVENAREWESFENIADPEDGGDGQNHPERRPRLMVYYSLASNVQIIPIQILGEPITDTLDDGTVITFDTSSDDAEQENDEMDALFDDDIDAGWEGDPEDQNILTAGMRFRGINIPQGAVIDSAFIVVHSHEGKSADDVAMITIVGEAADNAATYDLESLITDRPETSASIMWEVAEEWELWEPYKTPDLQVIVQELVNRSGWQSGNAMAFMFKGEDQGPSTVENAREWESYENIADPEDGGDGQNHPERVPRLFIYFQGPAGIFDNPRVEKLNIYPNPAASGTVNVILQSDKPAKIQIYDITGRMVVSVMTTQTNRDQIDISDLTDGMYIVKATQDQTIYTQKLIIR